jgi:formiminotetrahydrofolate cyclodeaminase
LIEMVVNLTLGKPAYTEHEDHVRPVGQRAHTLRQRALDLVADDAAAFDAVMAACAMPKQSEPDKAARRTAIQTATLAAAHPPLQVAEIAVEVLRLAEVLPGRSNPHVLSDVGVAASLAVAAVESAAINVEINLAGLTDPQDRERLRGQLDALLAAVPRGREIVTAVRQEIAG